MDVLTSCTLLAVWFVPSATWLVVWAICWVACAAWSADWPSSSFASVRVWTL